MLRVEERIRKYQPYFGRWRLKEGGMLGRGTSGSVFTIHDGPLEAALKVVPIPRDDARLKELQAQYSSEEEIRRALREELELVKDEIAIMRRIWSESNIVCFEESVIIDRDDTYGWDVLIRMEKLIRVDHFLKGEYERYGYSRNRDLMVRMWDELLSGLLVCEKNRIVHLDIKPENIFYAPGRDHFKLGDFGVSVRKESGRRVAENMIVGTLDYMAPEIRQGQGGDSRSDIYSLALTIYQMINGDRLPFMPSLGAVTEEDRRRAVETRLEGKKPIPRLKSMDSATMDVLARCLEYFPENRYQTVEDARNDLRKIIYGGAVEETGEHKSKVLPILIAAASLGLVGVLVLLGVRLANPGKPTEDPFAGVPQVTSAVITPEPTQFVPEITVDPNAGDGVTVNGNMLFAGIDGGAVGYVDLTITGDVTLEAQINGQPVEALRAGEFPEDRRGLNWPADGLCFVVPASEPNRTIEMSAVCRSAEGEELYSWSSTGHWRQTASGAGVFMQGDAPEATSEPTEAPTAEPTAEATMDPTPVTVAVDINSSLRPDGVVEVDGDSVTFRWTSEGSVESYSALITDSSGNIVAQLPQTEDVIAEVGTSLFGRGEVYWIRIGARPVGGGDGDMVWTEARFMLTPELDDVGDLIDGLSDPESILFVQQRLFRQELLAAEYVDGLYNNATYEAVVAFQRMVNRDAGGEVLEVMGYCDAATVEYLIAYDSGEPVTPMSVETPAPLESVSVSINGTLNEQGVVEVGEKILTLSWFAEGDVESFSVRITDENGMSSYGWSDTVDTQRTLRSDKFDPGKIYTVTVEAIPVGGSAEDALRTEAQFMRPDLRGVIELSGGYMVQGSDADEMLIYSGSAEPGSVVSVSLNGTFMEDVTADEDGFWACFLSGDGIREAAGDFARISFSYADGAAAVDAPGFDPRSVIPKIKLVDELRVGSGTLDGNTLPGAQVILFDTVDGILAETVANDSGFFIIDCSGFTLEEGRRMEITATDADGNFRYGEIYVSARREFAEITLTEAPAAIGRASCLFEGVAEPEQTLMFIWSQSDLEPVAAYTGEGSFSVTIQSPGPEAGDPAELLICYEDISNGSIVTYIPRDDECLLTAPAAVNDGTAELSLTGEPGASGSLTVNGAVVNEFRFDENGRYTLALPALTAGDALKLNAEDLCGNTAAMEYTVEQMEYLPLRITLDPAADGPVRCPDGLRIGVSGQPGRMFRLSMDVNGEPSVMEQTLDDAGECPMFFTDLSDGDYTLTFEYVDRPGEYVTVGAQIDNTAPAVSAEAWELVAGASNVAFRTEPGARVDILSGGECLRTFHADESGVAVLSVVDLPVGSYSLSVADAAGNVTEQAVSVRERAALFCGEAFVSRNNSLVFQGASEPCAPMRVRLGENSIEFVSSEYGDWIAMLPADWFPENQDVEVTVEYSDGTGEAITVTGRRDTVCGLNVLSCGEGALSVVGAADPGAVVCLYEGDALLGQTTAGENGTFSILLSAAARPGTQYTLRAEDPSGNTAEASVTVTEASRQPITLFASPVQNDGYFSGSVQLTVFGHAEHGQTLTIEFEADGRLTTYDVELPGVGSGTTEEYSLVVDPAAIFPADGDVTVTARYADGLAGSCAQSILLRYDNTAPSLYCDSEAIDEASERIEAYTDPGERVSLSVNGSLLAEGFADADGRVAFDCALTADDLIVLRAIDLAGNFAEHTFTVPARLPFASGALSIVEDAVPQGGTLCVQGWLAYAGDENLTFELRFENNGAVWTVPISGMTRMSDDEFAERFAPHSGSVRADAGCWIDQEVSISDQLEVGSVCSVRLSIENSAERLLFDGDSCLIEPRQVVEAQANPAFIGDCYAIGFDAAQPAGVFANDDVLLTGWYYGMEENGFEIVSVEYAPVDDPDNISVVELTECDLSDMPMGNCVVTLPRDVLAVCPADIPGLLPDVTPDENRPGFMLYLELPADKGDYILTLVTQVDGPYERTASIRVSLDRSVDFLPASLCARIADAWAPAEDAPALTIDGVAPSGITHVSGDSIALSWAAPGEIEAYTLTVSSLDGNVYAEHVTSDTGARLPLSNLPTNQLLEIRVSTGSADAIAYIRRG